MTVVTGKHNLRKIVYWRRTIYLYLIKQLNSVLSYFSYSSSFIFVIILCFILSSCNVLPVLGCFSSLKEQHCDTDCFLQYEEVIKLLRIFRLHRMSLQVCCSNLVWFLSVFSSISLIIGIFYLYLHSFKKQSKDEEVCPRLEGIFCGACQCKECPY